jgi:hypothetical protein
MSAAAVKNPLQHSESALEIETPDHNMRNEFHAINNRRDMSQAHVAMNGYTNRFDMNPDLERAYASRRRQTLPSMRKGAMVLQVLLLLYFVVNISALFQDQKEVAAIYMLSYPVRFAAVLVSLIIVYWLESFENWQQALTVAIALPVCALMVFNGYKYAHFIKYMKADSTAVLAHLPVGAAAAAGGAGAFPLNASFLEGLVMAGTLKINADAPAAEWFQEILEYWSSKTVTASNRIWPTLMLCTMLVLRVDFVYCVRICVAGLVTWFFTNGFASGEWFSVKSVMLVFGCNLALLYVCFIADRLSRQNFLYEHALALENESLQGKLDDIERYAEANEDEKEIVKMVLGEAHSKNRDLHELNFDDLKLEKIVGAGASGEVIKASYLGTTVVVKRMLRSNITKENLAAFTIEAELMSGLHHPNIVQFIGASFSTYSNICMVLEWVPRGDLFGLLRSGMSANFGWSDPLLKMACDCAGGMSYLHGCNPPVIHRDLKSLNILVTETFGCKITDFGMSRQSQAAKGMEMAMTLVGTPLWVPPEVIKSEKYSEKIDVYSFGIVLCELETKEMPYGDYAAREGMTKWKLLNMIAHEGIRPTLPAPSDMNAEVRNVIDACLQSDPSHRPSMEQVLSRLQGQVRRSIEADAAEASRRSAAGSGRGAALGQGVAQSAHDLAAL